MIAKANLPRPVHRWMRWALLLLVFLAFSRLVFLLDAKELWLDEGFSLQRADSNLASNLRDVLLISDGANEVRTTDQHPFVYFLSLGASSRLIGRSEFALRFPSVIAATLLVPVAWALSRRLAFRLVLPPTTPFWAALLVAVNPFYLWYGQEVRMYALVALMAAASTFFALRWTDARRGARRHCWMVAYALSLALLLGSHYFSVLILPVHAIVLYQRQMPAGRRRALIGVVGVLMLGLVVGVLAIRPIVTQPGAGSNFAAISLRILVPDLINAFTLGLSVDIGRVWPIDVVAAATALVGVAWGVRRKQVALDLGWLLPALVGVPAALLLLVNLVRPAYMTARHMSLISGGFLLLLGSGLAWMWEHKRWLGVPVTALLLGGALYSSANYYTLPAYAKGDLRGLGAHLQEHIQPGDFVLLEPPLWHYLYRYYLPLDAIEEWSEAGLAVGWRALPPVNSSGPGSVELLQSLSGGYRRIWLARSVVESQAAPWLMEHKFRAQDLGFETPLSILKLDLFLTESPILDHLPADINHPMDVAFADVIGLRGYDLGQPFESDTAVPVTFYWQPQQLTERRYKYVLRWVVRDSDGREHMLAVTEHEPYDGVFPTNLWIPGQTIREHSTILLPAGPPAGQAYWTLQVYDAETLDKLPIARAQGGQVLGDGFTLMLPQSLPTPLHSKGTQ